MPKRATMTIATLLTSAAALLVLRGSSPGLAETPTTTPGAMWSGRVLAVVPDLSLSSTVLRVKVTGRSQQLVTVTWADYSTTTVTGLKAELEPDVAEFAPVPAGPVTVSVPELGASLGLSVDGHSYVIVEFTLEQLPTATPTDTPTSLPSATPSLWQGRMVTSTTDLGLAGSVLRVTVAGVTAQPVTVSNRQGWSTTNWTGLKPELGPYTAEFAPVPTGTITIDLGSLGASLTIELAGQHYVYVEFTPVGQTPTATPTRTPHPTLTPRRTATRTPTLTPSPTLPPPGTWIGQIKADASGFFTSGSMVRVSIPGQEGTSVTVGNARRQRTVVTGSQPGVGQYVAQFTSLPADIYTVTANELDAELTVVADGTNLIVVEFSQVAGSTYTPTPSPTPSPSATSSPTPTPSNTPTPTPTATPTPLLSWSGRMVTSIEGVSESGSTLRVSVARRPGLPVIVASTSGHVVVHRTNHRPEYGAYQAEFPGLAKGIYLVVPVGLDTSLLVHADGQSYLVAEFTAEELPTPTPMVTALSLTLTPTLTPTPSPTPRSVPTPWPTLVPTATTSPTPGPTATTQAIWFGHVVQHVHNQTIYGSIAVRVAGMKGLEVDINTGGGYAATCITGSKPEYGETACEVGGLLSGGTYTIAPRGLGASLQVTLQQGDFVLVEFLYDVPPTPELADGATWTGYVVSNTSGQPTDRDNSAIVVRVLGPPGIDVEIFSATGWHNLATTGTKPEHGNSACEFGNLRADTYTIVPKDLRASVEVTVDGQGVAVVEFAPGS